MYERGTFFQYLFGLWLPQEYFAQLERQRVSNTFYRHVQLLDTGLCTRRPGFESHVGKRWRVSLGQVFQQYLSLYQCPISTFHSFTTAAV